MQLSVFLTPILSHQLRMGYGVCEELAIFSQDTSSSASSQQQVQSRIASAPDTPHEAMSVTGMPEMDMSHAAPVSTVSEHKADSQAPPMHHAFCDFCLLFGHSVLPPLHTIALILVLIAVSFNAAQIDAIRFLFFTHNKNLRPQGRAPPQFIL